MKWIMQVTSGNLKFLSTFAHEFRVHALNIVAIGRRRQLHNLVVTLRYWAVWAFDILDPATRFDEVAKSSSLSCRVASTCGQWRGWSWVRRSWNDFGEAGLEPWKSRQLLTDHTTLFLVQRSSQKIHSRGIARDVSPLCILPSGPHQN